MKAILALSGGIPQSRGRKDDDFCDRLSSRYTVSILLVFAIVVTTKQYVGDRITCWVPAFFSGEWTDYTHSYCWIKNTYYLPIDKNIPGEHENWKKNHLSYYQWVPLILLVQALLYYMPALVWRGLNDRSGIDVHSLVTTALTFHAAEKADKREENLRALVRQMHRFLNNRRAKTQQCEMSLSYLFSKFLCRKCGRQNGNYLNTVYLFTKVLFIVNAVGQIFLLNFFLGQDFHMYGFDAAQIWTHGGDLADSARFPRVTMCDFKVRVLGNVQRYNVQCVLPINLFHENVYLIVWFWMVFVAIISIYSFISWLGQMMWRIDKHRFIKKHLHPEVRKMVKEDKTPLARFTTNYLGSDGVFVLRLLLANTDDIALTEITTALWDNYRIPEKVPFEDTGF